MEDADLNGQPTTADSTLVHASLALAMAPTTEGRPTLASNRQRLCFSEANARNRPRTSLPKVCYAVGEGGKFGHEFKRGGSGIRDSRYGPMTIPKLESWISHHDKRPLRPPPIHAGKRSIWPRMRPPQRIGLQQGERVSRRNKSGRPTHQPPAPTGTGLASLQSSSSA